MQDIPALGFIKPLLDPLVIVITFQQLLVLLLRGQKDALIMPERIVRIEGNGSNH
jgi:hypothetical protein